MEQTLVRSKNQKYFARKLTDGTTVEAIIGPSGTVTDFNGNLRLALTDLLPSKHPLAMRILSSSQRILKTCGCTQELAEQIKKAIYEADERKLQGLLKQLTSVPI